MNQELESNNITDEKKRVEYMNTHFLEEGRTVFGLVDLQRNSALVSIFSLVEGNFSRICNEFEICLKPSIRLKEIGGKGSLDNYWNYLKKVVDVDLNNLDNTFYKLKEYYYLRNRIIHENNIIKDDKKAKDLERKYSYLKVYHEIYWHKFFIKDDEFLIGLIDEILGFFEDLYIQLHKRITESVSIFIDPDSNLTIDNPRENI